MKALPAPWLVPTRALREPAGPAWADWDRWQALLQRPFALAPWELPAALRFGTALGWVPTASLPHSLQSEVAAGLEGAAGIAARLRLHATLEWLLSRRLQVADWPAYESRRALLRAVARLEPNELPSDAPETPAARHALRPLADLRRYGPDEPYIAASLGEAIGDYPSAPEDSAATWLLGQLNLVAAWVGLTRRQGESFLKLVQRSSVVEDSWPGWLVAGRRDAELARYRAYLAGEAAWRASRPMAGHEPEAVAWQGAEARGWMLAAAGDREPARVRACEPGILTGG